MTIIGKRPAIAFSPLKTIDFTPLGLGDNLMAWAGLHALLSSGFEVTAQGCVLRVPTAMAGLAAALFTRYGLAVEGVSARRPGRQASPVFTSAPPETGRDWYKTFVGVDWRMNCFEALDRQKFMPRSAAGTARNALRLALSERILYRRGGWRSASADYVGYRLWLPLARKIGLMPLVFLAMMKRSLPALRQDIAAYIERHEASRMRAAPDIAIFPAGKSFQAFAPAACRRLREHLPANGLRFYVQSDDPWISGYRAAGIEPHDLGSIEELFWIVKSARSVMTTDSFSSHAAQLLRDDFVLALTRDLRENVVHPGAYPTIVANHPDCSPCQYIPRVESETCPADRAHCVAFDDAAFIRAILEAMAALSPRESHRNPGSQAAAR